MVERILPAWWLGIHIIAECEICGKYLIHGSNRAKTLEEAAAAGHRGAHCLRPPKCPAYQLVVVGDGREEPWLARDLARPYNRQKGPPAEARARAAHTLSVILAKKEPNA